MKNHFARSVMGFIVFLGFASVLFAQNASQPQAAKPGIDLSGIWTAGGGMAGGAEGRGFSATEPPLQPSALEKFRANRAGLTKFSDKGLDELDPSTYCFPPGAPRSMVMPYAFEVVQRADIVYLLFEYNSGVRRVYLDGRKHPAMPEPTWMGHSIGAWQGDTLVVDTVGLRPETWLDPLGTPHSDALHMVERFRRPSRDTLEVEFLFDDPKTFTKSWGGKKTYHLETEDISEYMVCEDQLQMGKTNQAH